MQKVWGYMSDKLLEAINLEPDPEIVGMMMDSLCRVSRDTVSFPCFNSSIVEGGTK